MGNIIPFGNRPPKASQSKMETLIITPALADLWKKPPCQRPIRINEKVRRVGEQIKITETIEGVLTLGKIKHDDALYVVDGQHRIEAFKLSGLQQALTDVRIVMFDNMAELAAEFHRLNSRLVNMRPDDNLRALEESIPALQMIRKSCEFVGYDYIRRNTTSPIVSMSALLRCWTASSGDTPAGSNSGRSASEIAETLDQQTAQNLIAFLSTAHSAWGRDPEYYRLWGNLNMTLCMWLWRKLVIDRDRMGNKRYAVLSIPEFKKCLMSVSADGEYLSWLPGRNLTDRDRSPCYGKLKAIFAKRMAVEAGGKKLLLPAPAWASK
jgi:hypothetical protein